MPSERFRIVRAVTTAALVATFAIPQSVIAEAADHLVSPSDLQNSAVNASQRRQQNLESLKSFLGTSQARHAMETAHMNPDQVTTAIASLNDDELAQLAQRADKAKSDFAAGSLSDRDLIVILLLVAALILVIVAVR
ncbi:MAG TPA: PA2779 family protein [Terracidiphilus sp.]|jgi:hypothetical protein|nr:PA2779 family protein [Terracidiphilus sp.]